MVTHELLDIEKALVLDIDNHIILPFIILPFMCRKTVSLFNERNDIRWSSYRWIHLNC